ncbi:BRCA1 domain containing protein [Entamoeba histolytica HM-1:IMSS-B]|uniref:BRCT domain-containing protein n=6 Tax=Entamoeba histolytica TaxID=5759 RepID=C4M383_ENTH1|nr:hypothetical protein EHI_106080 [Entamoeba histolytica HM-1:IMSS]EMD48931.1 BRCA1 C terminus (BRCT) domain containing protein [Entamoeba histolytica KU27]EMH72805.1 BRCA1 domain containing protein [Entamoeba histolytica HM-1:IMSS-B]EMS15427.1 BRCA1 C Terminus (BRCT) domain containing protein [Entamoeba histolytica HM-3:IMSS]ENY61038.1 BRCA1 C Terminus (BRCT) domain containing protein [Entamoeba histolytica HM-1:IMSS-A]GAT95763.1 hypothetical protein conserved domain containing [Entamoeba hi|eukprot:XP_648486.1 hypothetical protein EHI_106080 [Entamoeba histolytica HM-1:IMSS]
MERNSFQSTQAFIDALVQANKEMDDNMQQMTPVLQGLMDKISILTKENDELRDVLQQTIDKLDEVKKEHEVVEKKEENIHQIKEENILLKRENEENEALIRQLRQQIYLLEQTHTNQLDDLRTQIKHRDQQIDIFQKERDNIVNEIVMARQQISILLKQLETAQNEITTQRYMEEYNKKLDDMNYKFEEMKKSIEKVNYQINERKSVIETSYIDTISINEPIKEEETNNKEEFILSENELKTSPMRLALFKQPDFLNSPKVIIHLSGISKETRESLSEEVMKKGFEISVNYSNKVTHVVVSSKLTMTSIKALIEGKWVVSKNWIINGMKKDEFKYGFQKFNLFKGKKVFATELFTRDQTGMEIWETLVRFGQIEVEQQPELADICLIGKKEEVQGKHVFTKEEFLKSLPLPRTVLTDGSIPSKCVLTKIPLAI